MGDATILSEEQFKEKIKEQLKTAFTVTQVDKNDPFLDTLIDKAFDEFYSAIGDNNWEKKKNEATAIEFANSIARNILGAYGQNYETTHSGIKWDKKIEKSEIPTMIQLGITQFNLLDVIKFKVDKNRDMTRELIATVFTHDIADRYAMERKSKTSKQAPERLMQIEMLQKIITALNGADLPLETKVSILRHTLRTLQDKLPSSSALLHIVNRMNESLMTMKINPKNHIQQQADAAAFYSALQTDGPLAPLLEDKSCSKLVATMMKQAEKLAPEANLTGRLQRIQPATSPGPSATDVSPRFTPQKDSQKKQGKAAPADKRETPIAEDKSKPKKPKPTS